MAAALTDDGDFGLAYLPSSRTVTMNLDRLKGPVNVQWYDPTSGEFRVAEGAPLVPGGKRDLTSPGKNRAGEADWVLVLEGGVPASPPSAVAAPR